MTNSFVVRAWYEHRDVATSPALWRGIIEDVQRHEQCYCYRPVELLDVLSNWLVRELVTNHRELRHERSTNSAK